MRFKTVLKYTALGATVGGGFFVFYNKIFTHNGALDREEVKSLPKDGVCHLLPSRNKQWKKLGEQQFDILVIGAGATGTGVALDAISRGLQTALVEKNDFSSGTSSRATKMAHGGVRYLESAITKFDFSELYFVYDGLHERKHFFTVAPHLTKPLPLITPCYTYWECLRMFVGLRLYDIMQGGKAKIGPSKWLSKEETLQVCPHIKKDGLKGSMRYYDGLFNDARMATSLALTSAILGGCVLNHAEVIQLLKNEDGKVIGATVRDNLSGQTKNVYAKVVINATGPFTDSIRKLDNPNASNIMVGSAGAHITLDAKFAPKQNGVLLPKTHDGRVLFLVPWEGRVIAGTTDSPTSVKDTPSPTEEDIQFILEHVQENFDCELKREDVLSSWSGIRPLAKDPNYSSENTSVLSRELYIDVSDSNLVTITGGKWTCYQRMGKETVDTAIRVGKLLPKNQKSLATRTPLIGARNWDDSIPGGVSLDEYKLPADIEEHLKHFYGDRAPIVAEIAKKEGLLNRISEKFPFIEAEIVYQIENEYAFTPTDVLAYRLTLMFLDRKETLKALPRVVDIMANKLGWDSKKSKEMEVKAREYIEKCTR